MKRKLRKKYKQHLKATKKEFGFFPPDFKITIKAIFKAFEASNLEI